ncbi:MAG TPA: bifunctional alpha,alpha-trehalose-phosphate synthase (UDP-forming)/trehalose-phosphatase [Thermoplasmata archaeon]|nr:bifunctional alpha,alpha-trehalose-phosphate synthase (UDP-forming)/trehalose-phosphatase [Thermoplasmata archaeon]
MRRLRGSASAGPVDMNLILVSNRLPVSVRRVGKELEVRPNPGGVAAGLASFYREYGARWFGWPGEVAPEETGPIAARLESEFDCHPIFLPRQLARAYYGGFSNGTLWPLLHSFSTYVRYSASDWNAYRDVNERFADEIARAVRPGDVVWIHDYQLMLLPRLIRERKPDARIGFFLHVPFPPYDVLRLLPWHRDLLQGLLGADLVGFHTYDYMRAFLSGVRRGLGLESRIGTIVMGHRLAQVDVFPLGIDYETFASTPISPATEHAIGRMRKGPGSSKLVFSISRLDYTKGIPQQVEAYGQFLATHPEWRRKVTYLLAVVPSRERVAEYARLKREIDENVGRINSRYGTMAWTPIRYLFRQLDFEELLGLYRTSDVAFIVPLRDGMNLVAKEYVASKQEPHGVLILSEMAGASKELLEALVVNPNDVDEVVAAIDRSLTMPPEEQAVRIRAMQDRLRRYDARTWAKRFLERLDDVVRLSQDVTVKGLTSAHRKKIETRYRVAKRRLLMFDYDGTIVPFSVNRDAVTPDARVMDLAKELSSDPANHVALVSGRSRRDLEKWFGGLPMTLIGEHGAWIRDRGDLEWKALLPLDAAWKDRVRPFIDRFVERVPGSSTEEKDFSIAWHYRAVDPESGAAAAKELVDVLASLTVNFDLQVLSGNKVVEIRRGGVNKGTYFATHLAREPWDFILAAGDDWTDEALFGVLPSDAISIHIGFAPSAAGFNLEAPNDLLDVLESFVR